MTDATAAATPEAIGSILTSTDPSVAPGTPIILILKGGIITSSYGNQTTYCDTTEEQKNTCGA